MEELVRDRKEELKYDERGLEKVIAIRRARHIEG